LSTQEEIVEDLDNELFLGFGKKNKEKKTGKAKDVVKKLIANNHEAFDTH
jgi:hypothetical protein|tara:strand:+ start:103 stop:252 length:150 start_codon:yes stop_codon:yes gene_type:complete